MKEAREILRLAKEMLALDDSREGNVLTYLYGHRTATPFQMTKDLGLEIDEAKAIYDITTSEIGPHGVNTKGERWMLDQIRKILARSGNSKNPLDGMSNERARKEVYKIMAQFTRGVFRDDYWAPVNNIWKAFNSASLDWTMTGANYLHNDKGDASGKEWKFEMSFVNKNGRPTTMHGTVTASGCGTIQDILSCYDLTALVF